MPPPAPHPSRRRRLLRAAGLGLLLGVALGGLSLMTMGAVRLASAPQCPDARGACLLEREVRREVGLRQLGLGGGLALLALGVWLLQRGERAAETG